MDPSMVQEGECPVRLKDGRQKGLKTVTMGSCSGAKPQQELLSNLPGPVVEL